MIFKAPRFWEEKNSFLSIFLLPISYIYYFTYLVYCKIKKEKIISIPVICIGNAVVGGSGKTPITIKVRNLLSKNFKNIFVLTRGYQGQNKGPLVVSKLNNHREIGDEGIIHSYHGLTCISRDRVKGAKECQKQNADIILMDDGYQSKNVKKNLSILVVDSTYLFGNERIFPSGPLREPINSAIEKADCVVMIGDSFNKVHLKKMLQKKIFYAEKKLITKKLKNKNIFAFCGLGNNMNFLFLLKILGLNVREFKEFPDHYSFKNSDLKIIIECAKQNNLEIVCTRKDFVKIPENLRKFFNVADLEIVFKQEKKFLDFLLEKTKY